MVNDIQGTSDMWCKINFKAIYRGLSDWIKLLSRCDHLVGKREMQ